MDRDAIARERRRREALDAIEFEREREAVLRDQIEEIVLEGERERIDGEALARLDPADAAVVREILGDDGDAVIEPDDADEWESDFVDLDDELDVEDEDDGDAMADEIGRLQGEIAESQRRQQALARFVSALAEPAPTSGVGS